MKRKTKTVLSVILLALVFIYPMIGRGAEKDSVSVKLVWEKEFPHPVKDFSLAEKKGIPALQTIITTNEIIFGEGKGAKRINVSGFLSPNGEYIGIAKVHYGDKDDILPGSKFYIYDRKGNLVLEKKVNGKTGETTPYILNNGNPIFTLNPWGWSHLGIVDKNTGKTIKVVHPINDFWSSGHLDIAEKEGFFTICVTGTEEQKESMVILYDSIGNEIWKRKLDPGWTGTVAISPYGNYISAVGKGVRWLYEFNRKGDLLWKLRTSVVDVMKYSEDEEHLIVCGPPNTIKFILSKSGDIKWKYKLPEGRDFFAVDISSNNNYIIGIDGGGGREVPSGDTNIVYLFDNNGNILWKKPYKGINWKMPEVSFSQNSKYFIMAIGKKIYCYEIGGIK